MDEGGHTLRTVKYRFDHVIPKGLHRNRGDSRATVNDSDGGLTLTLKEGWPRLLGMEDGRVSEAGEQRARPKFGADAKTGQQVSLHKIFVGSPSNTA